MDRIELKIYELKTQFPQDDAKRVIEGLHENPTGWTHGVAVTKEKNGVYGVDRCKARIVGNQIWTGRESGFRIRSRLESEKIGYRFARVSVKKSVAGRRSKPFNLEGNVEIDYIPRNVLDV